MSNDPNVPWTDEQWARVNQVIQEEAGRARLAASFLPLFGPLEASADFVRAETIPFDPPLGIQDRNTIQLATLQVKVSLRGAQLADPELRSALAVFRRAANVLGRLEDTIIFTGLTQNAEGKLAPPPKPGGGLAGGLPVIWEVRRG
jgi:Encapsulating protein for peroxidase